MIDEIKITTQGEYSCLQVHLQPRASRNEISGVVEQGLKIRLTAPPVDDRANRQLVDFLAETLDLPRRDVVLLHGQKSRSKTVGFKSIDRDELARRLHNILYN
ncbi:MAG: YggU family protein [Acidobacteria bacterium]|nr:MAG: YggU family protein [Acidobacteriota bacterium]